MNRIHSLQAEPTSLLPATQGIVQRKCACGNHSIVGEKCKECVKKNRGLQRKLAIGAGNDPLEHEADRVADQVMAMSTNSRIGKTPLRIQRFTGQSTGQLDTVPSSVDRVLAGSGRPMEPMLRKDMEQRFGHDFSQVRVHSGMAAEQSAQDVNANAYTAGNNIVFGAGKLAPRTREGRRLIAHELTHVVQQENSRIQNRDGTTNSLGRGLTAGTHGMDATSHQNSPLLRRVAVAQLIQLQRRDARTREGTISVRWIDDDVRFYHQVINAISRSRSFRGTRKASLWQPFHDPIFRLFRRLNRRRPLLSNGNLIRLRSSAWVDPTVFHGQVASASIEIEQEARQSEISVPEQNVDAGQNPEIESESRIASSPVTVDSSIASVSWIDASSPAGGMVSDSPPTSRITENFITGSSGYRFSNYLHAWLKTHDSTHIVNSGFSTNSGIYKSPSFLNIPSRSFPIRRSTNAISRAGIDGIEFEQTVGARTISAAVIGGGVGVVGGMIAGAKIGGAGGAFFGGVGAVPGAIGGALVGGVTGYFAGTAVANRAVNFPPIWTKMKLKLFANGDKECEVIEHSLFPSQSYYCDMTRVGVYSALARQQTSWENNGWDTGNPWRVSRPLFTP